MRVFLGAISLGAVLWVASVQAQAPERCTTSEWACDQAGVPYTPLPALGALTRALSGEPELLRTVRSIVVLPCADLATNQQQGKDCSEPDGTFAIVETEPEAGTIRVARLLTGEPIGVVVQMLRAACTVYAWDTWREMDSARIERCVNGER